MDTRNATLNELKSKPDYDRIDNELLKNDSRSLDNEKKEFSKWVSLCNERTIEEKAKTASQWVSNMTERQPDKVLEISAYAGRQLDVSKDKDNLDIYLSCLEESLKDKVPNVRFSVTFSLIPMLTPGLDDDKKEHSMATLQNAYIDRTEEKEAKKEIPGHTAVEKQSVKDLEKDLFSIIARAEAKSTLIKNEAVKSESLEKENLRSNLPQTPTEPIERMDTNEVKIEPIPGKEEPVVDISYTESVDRNSVDARSQDKELTPDIIRNMSTDELNLLVDEILLSRSVARRENEELKEDKEQTFDIRDKSSSKDEELKNDSKDGKNKLIDSVRDISETARAKFDAKKEELLERISSSKGTVEGILERGTDLRDKALEKGAEFKDRVLEKSAELKDRALEKSAELKDRTLNKLGDVREELRTEIRQVADRLLGAVREVPLSIKERLPDVRIEELLNRDRNRPKDEARDATLRIQKLTDIRLKELSRDIERIERTTIQRDVVLAKNKYAGQNEAIEAFYNLTIGESRLRAPSDKARDNIEECIRAITDYEKYGLDRETLVKALDKKDDIRSMTPEERDIYKEYRKLEKEVQKLSERLVDIKADNFSKYDGLARQNDLRAMPVRTNEQKEEDKKLFVTLQNERYEDLRGRGLSYGHDRTSELLEKGMKNFREEYRQIMVSRAAIDKSISRNMLANASRGEELASQRIEINRYASTIIDKYKDMTEEFRSVIDADALKRAHENKTGMLSQEERQALILEREYNNYSRELDDAFESMKYGKELSIESVKGNLSAEYNAIDALSSRGNHLIGQKSIIWDKNIVLGRDADKGLQLRDRSNEKGNSGSFSSIERDDRMKEFLDKYDKSELLSYAREKKNYNQDDKFVGMLPIGEQLLIVKDYWNRNEECRSWNKIAPQINRIDKERLKEEERAEAVLRKEDVKAAKYMYELGILPREKDENSINADFDERYRIYYDLRQSAQKSLDQKTQEAYSEVFMDKDKSIARNDNLKNHYDNYESVVARYTDEEQRYYDSLRLIERTDRSAFKGIKDEKYHVYKIAKETMEDIASRLSEYKDTSRDWHLLAREAEPRDLQKESRIESELDLAKELTLKFAVELRHLNSEKDNNAVSDIFYGTAIGKSDNDPGKLQEIYSALKEAYKNLPSSETYITDIRNQQVITSIKNRGGDMDNQIYSSLGKELDPRQHEARRLIEKSMYECYYELKIRGKADEKMQLEMSNIDFVYNPALNESLLKDELRDSPEAMYESLSRYSQSKLDRENILGRVIKNDDKLVERSFFEKARDYAVSFSSRIKDIAAEREFKKFSQSIFNYTDFIKMSDRAQNLYYIRTNDKNVLQQIDNSNFEPRETELARFFKSQRETVSV